MNLPQVIKTIKNIKNNIPDVYLSIINEELIQKAEKYYGFEIPTNWKQVLLQLGKVPYEMYWREYKLDFHPVYAAEHQVETDDGIRITEKQMIVIAYAEGIGDSIVLSRDDNETDPIVYFHDHESGLDSKISSLSEFFSDIFNLPKNELSVSFNPNSETSILKILGVDKSLLKKEDFVIDTPKNKFRGVDTYLDYSIQVKSKFEIIDKILIRVFKGDTFEFPGESKNRLFFESKKSYTPEQAMKLMNAFVYELGPDVNGASYWANKDYRSFYSGTVWRRWEFNDYYGFIFTAYKSKIYFEAECDHIRLQY